MRNCALLIFAISTAALGLLYLETKVELDSARSKLAALEATKTTDSERDAFGAQCVKWLREEGVKEGRKAEDFYLGRSWKKHGQFVFEVVVPKDEKGLSSGDAICTYDYQSGMLYGYYGAAREKWMFY